MKVFSRLFNTLPKKLIAGSLIALGIALPVAASAAQTVTISANTGVANVTAGDTSYASSVNATYDQVIKVQVQYDNTEAPGSGLNADGVHIKINLPTTPGETQTVTTTTAGSNTNTVNGQAVVHLDNATAYLQYIPNSGQAAITNTNGTTSYVAVPDSVIESAQGYDVNNGNPCQGAAVAVEARVMVPGVKIVKQSEILGQTNQWSNDNTAKPGDTLVYMLTYQDIGNTDESNVVIRDSLPPQMTQIPGTTYLYNQTNPKGVKINSDNITNGGINIGGYVPGGGAYVTFEAKLPAASELQCGKTEFRNVGVAQPQGMNQYYNTAITDVTKTCASTPTYACTNLDVTSGDNRTVTLGNFQESATNGATFTSVVINWGDNSTPLTTNNVNGQTHQFAADGTYTVSATLNFSVNGQNKTANSASCTKTVSFTTPSTPTTPTTPSTPTQLVNTGPGDVAAIFGLTTIAGAVAHRLFSRRFARG